MKKTFLKLAFATTLIAGSVSAANAAVYDFLDWIDNANTNWLGANPGEFRTGEQGANQFIFESSGLTLTTSAYESVLDGNGAETQTVSNVYMDGRSGGPGGMGACTSLTGNAQCDPSSDDNVSFDTINGTDSREVLVWEFDTAVDSMTLNLGDKSHNAFGTGSDLEYNIGNGWELGTATAGGTDFSVLSLDFLNNGAGDSITSIMFRTAAKVGQDITTNKAFYIQYADVDFTSSVTAVPEASTYALMLSGLGFVGFMVKRRKKA